MRIMERQTHRAGTGYHGKGTNRLKTVKGVANPTFFYRI
jgi:hypothetical protein